MERWAKLDQIDEHGNTHQCIDGPFCWLYGRIIKDMFIPWSGYGDKIINSIKEWENVQKT